MSLTKDPHDNHSAADYQQLMSTANAAADRAEQVIAAHRAAGDWQVSYKADDSPVTEVDVAVEEAIRAVLADATPGAAFFGEETGQSAALAQGSGDNATGSSDLWLVDPIDGTKSFIRNMPYFSTQVALMRDNRLCVGVSNAPDYGQRLVAAYGHGVTLDNELVHTRNVRRLADVFLSTGNLTRMAQCSDAWLALAQVITQVRRVRGYGDFCHYHQLCCGQTDLIIESDVNILDIAALAVGVREAGGVITDLAGSEIGLDTRSVLAAATPELHAEVLPYFSGFVQVH